MQYHHRLSAFSLAPVVVVDVMAIIGTKQYREEWTHLTSNCEEATFKCVFVLVNRLNGMSISLSECIGFNKFLLPSLPD